SWWGILRRSRIWLGLTFAIVVLCQTDFFLQSVRIPPQVGDAVAAPVPVYGPAIHVYVVFFALGILALIIGSGRDLGQTTGSERAELTFLMVSAITILPVSLIVGFLVHFFVGASQTIWIAPLR